MYNYLIEIQINSIDSFYILRKLIEKSPGIFKFRGQSNSDWSLTPSIERNNNNYLLDILDYEHISLNKIKKCIANYNLEFKIPPDDDYAQWFSIIQHYGGKTRLLDFTSAFYIALFFAIHDQFKNTSKKIPRFSAIWIIPPNDSDFDLKDEYTQEETEEIYFGKNNKEFNDIYKECLIKYECTSKLGILHLIPDKESKRSQIQKASFLVGRNFSKNFEENVFSKVPIIPTKWKLKQNLKEIKKYFQDDLHSRNAVLKIKIHNKLFGQLQKLLNQMGITYSTIFPDFSGLISEIYID